jgi:cytochrome b6-f complex iron-sulfur subunit
MAEDKKSPGQHTKTKRRGFLNILWSVLGLAALGEMVWLAGSFFRPRRFDGKTDGTSTMVTAGPVSNFHTHTVTAFQTGQFYLARLKDGGFLAISRKCTHLGCTIPWVKGKDRFVCPCHGSVFDITGSVLEAPAPRALDLYPVKIVNRVVQVNTGKRIKRSNFKPEQITYPSAS